MTGIRTPDDEVNKPGWFTAPFTEGWTYQGQTYAGHSSYSVDWNRRTKTGGWLEDTGDPVYAAADGTVAEVDKSNGLVMLNHWGGLWRTEYRHMTGIPVKVGDKVQRGDRVGSIGNVAGDGRSFGAHLHHVHWKRSDPTKPFQRTRMRFYDKPVEVSVADSDTKPAAWDPPDPVMLEGPPPKATWESSFREASAALAKAETARDGWKERAGLNKDERDDARRALDSAKSALVVLTDQMTTAQARIRELEAATPIDCTTAVNAERRRVLDALETGVADFVASLR